MSHEKLIKFFKRSNKIKTYNPPLNQLGDSDTELELPNMNDENNRILLSPPDSQNYQIPQINLIPKKKKIKRNYSPPLNLLGESGSKLPKNFSHEQKPFLEQPLIQNNMENRSSLSRSSPDLPIKRIR